MSSNDIKIVFFDIDGTLYPLQGVSELNFQNAVNFLSENLDISQKKAIQRLEENGILPYASKTNNSITQYILSLGFLPTHWNNYRLMHYPIEHIDSENSVDVEILYKFKQNYKIIALSSNMYAIACKIFDKISIKKEVFEEIYCLDKNPLNDREFSKKNIMAYVSEAMDIPCSLMLSIGDRFSSDIKPMLELGGKGVLISCPKDISEIAEVLMNKGVRKANAKWDFYNE